MNQNVNQSSYMCQHKLVRRHKVFRFQRFFAKHFNVKNQMKSMFATICNTYSIIQCKIQMICYINSQKIIRVYTTTDNFLSEIIIIFSIQKTTNK